ncbi:amino acid ABC transporter permease [Pokkaliibacter sp. CJK22405]|uniref:amino acid ABC transporter permease n=1 Tax=Pokkaliibacter sp. CJK22405 TaxID=3384615 RepID=UPI00398530BF
MSSEANKPQATASTMPSNKPPFWNDPEKRALLFQALLILVVGLGIWAIVSNTLSNLEQRGITTGFGFFHETAGFGILQSLIPYTETDTYGRTFFVGLLNTLLVSVIGIVFATILGFLLGVARLSKNWLISKIALVYIEVFRNIPLLLQIFFWYFAVLRALPSARQSLSFGDAFFLNVRGFYVPRPVFENGSLGILIALVIGVVATVFLSIWSKKRQDQTGQTFPMFFAGLGLVVGLPVLAFFVTGMPVSLDMPELKGFNFRGGVTIIPEFLALVVALSIYTAAFIGEIVRSGIQSVNHGQTEAASALGLSNGKTLKLVIIPQAMRVIIPPLTSQYLNLTKNSSLATAIGYPDLVSVFAGTTLNQTGQAIEIIAITMAVYLTISLAISTFMNWYNNRMALVER